MMRFDAARAREWAAMMAIIQVMMGAGMAFMYGFFYPVVTPTIALFIVTGTPTLALIPLGLVMVPDRRERAEGPGDVRLHLVAAGAPERAGGVDLRPVHGALDPGAWWSPS